MKTNVRESSLETYYGDLVPKGLQAQQSVIVKAMAKLGPGWYSRRQISEASRLETSTVSARVNALLSANLLEEDDHLSPCPITARSVHKVRLPSNFFGAKQ